MGSMNKDRPLEPPFFQVGILVEDIAAARDELSRALGIVWGDTVERVNGDWTIQVCFSKEGPPYLELIEGPAGSPWDSRSGSRIDHVGYWTHGIEENKRRIAAEGFDIETDGAELGTPFTYHRGRASGLRIELIDDSIRDAFYERWGLDRPS
jgi:hypothetical protein